MNVNQFVSEFEIVFAHHIQPKSNDNDKNGRNVLKLLGISDEDGSLEKERMSLFVEQQQKNERDALKRVKWMMNIYRQCIRMKKSGQSGRFGFADAVTVGMDGYYSVTAVLADFQYILKNKEILLEDEKKRTQSESECDAESCFILKRSQREKDAQNENGNALKEWFLADGNGGNDDDDINTAVYLELFDSIHVFLEHTVRISPDEIQNAMGKKDEDDNGYDHLADTVCTILDKKKKSSSRFRRNKRSGTGSKFMTTTTNSQPSLTQKAANDNEDQEAKENLAIYQDAVYGNSSLLIQQQKQETVQHSEQTFVEALCVEIKAEALEQKEMARVATDIVPAIKTFVDNDGADSDAVIADMEDVNDSNIFNAVSSTNTLNDEPKHSVWEICHKFIAQTSGASDVYSSGWRYFYWEFYRNKVEEERVVFKRSSGGGRTESNPGYQLKDWYISSKYDNIKNEALNNRCHSLSLFQWKMVLKKAQIKLAEWRKNSRNRKLECNKSFWTHYDLEYETPITIPHIVALLMYTNYTKASYEFSKTFRKNSPFESDRLLKQRHSEVAVWGRLLREIVECYGQQLSARRDIKALYHGINREMIFPGTVIKLCGPVSTTLGMIHYIHSFVALSVSISVNILMFCLCVTLRLRNRIGFIWCRGNRRGNRG